MLFCIVVGWSGLDRGRDQTEQKQSNINLP